MLYHAHMVDPQTVQSPKRHLVLVSVIVNTGEDGYSVALIRWDGEPHLAMRWNGGAENPLGNPQSRGLPTWFVIPEDFQDSVLQDKHISQDSQALVRNFFASHR